MHWSVFRSGARCPIFEKLWNKGCNGIFQDRRYPALALASAGGNPHHLRWMCLETDSRGILEESGARVRDRNPGTLKRP